MKALFFTYSVPASIFSFSWSGRILNSNIPSLYTVPAGQPRREYIVTLAKTVRHENRGTCKQAGVPLRSPIKIFHWNDCLHWVTSISLSGGGDCSVLWGRGKGRQGKGEDGLMRLGERQGRMYEGGGEAGKNLWGRGKEERVEEGRKNLLGRVKGREVLSRPKGGKEREHESEKQKENDKKGGEGKQGKSG